MDEKKKELLERVAAYTVPELCDGCDVYETMDSEVKPWVGEKMIGYALTVNVPAGEGGILADAILMAQEGDIIVIAGKGNLRSSYWGDHRSICAARMGAAGVVIDGAFRDLEGCMEAGFPVFARGLTCGTAGKSGVGRINVPVSCAGAVVLPGDIVVGDRNGVCVIHPEEADEILERAEKKVAAQRRVLEEMNRTGEVITRIKKKS